MTAEEIIRKILDVKKIEDIISIKNFKEEYRSIASMIHPDKCSLEGASDAIVKLNQLKDKYENGTSYRDDAGSFKANGHFFRHSGNEALLRTSYENYCKLKSFTDDSSKHFHQYLPSEVFFESGQLIINFDKRAIPLSGLLLPQEHVNWILNRLLEFSAWIAQVGFVHCGINPESVFIIPENHGLQVVTFYHLTKKNRNVKTISGNYKTWYPPALFSNKIATSHIDLELIQKTAIYLLGDQSGVGVKLRKTHHDSFMNFVMKQHDNAYKTLSDYQELLRKNFKKEFHSLII